MTHQRGTGNNKKYCIVTLRDVELIDVAILNLMAHLFLTQKFS
jgi:hypothetical protein